MNSPKLSVLIADITTLDVDVVVNAANTWMRGGGGVDGAIHAAGGAEILEECISKFPDGLATGDAGYTTAGLMPAKHVVHTVGPDYSSGQRDSLLLDSCYRRSLEVADELGARSVAFPLISTGIYGWPINGAVTTAVWAVAGSHTNVEEIIFVVRNSENYELLQKAIQQME